MRRRHLLVANTAVLVYPELSPATTKQSCSFLPSLRGGSDLCNPDQGALQADGRGSVFGTTSIDEELFDVISGFGALSG